MKSELKNADLEIINTLTLLFDVRTDMELALFMLRDKPQSILKFNC